MPHMLVIGDSDAGVFRQAAKNTLDTYGVTTEVNSQGGRRLRNIPSLLASVMRSNTDIVIVTGLTCELWEFTPLVTGMTVPTLATLCDSFRPEAVATDMEDIVSNILKINPNCWIYLLLPPIKELYLFNEKRLSSDKYVGYRSILSEHPLFSRSAMAKASVVAYQRSLKLKDPIYSWRRTDLIIGSHAFNKYYEGIVGKVAKRPHVQYMQGEICELKSPLLSDGLHFTPLFVKILLKTLVPKCTWLAPVNIVVKPVLQQPSVVTPCSMISDSSVRAKTKVHVSTQTTSIMKVVDTKGIQTDPLLLNETEPITGSEENSVRKYLDLLINLKQRESAIPKTSLEWISLIEAVSTKMKLDIIQKPN